MFIGEFQHNIDAKGRLSIPMQFREAINAVPDRSLIITGNLDGCLVLYPSTEWNNFREKASKLPSLDTNIRRFLRFFYSKAAPCSLDKQGRILIPPSLREFAALDGEICLVGMENKIEIWHKARWEEESGQITASPDVLQKAMAELGM